MQLNKKIWSILNRDSDETASFQYNIASSLIMISDYSILKYSSETRGGHFEVAPVSVALAKQRRLVAFCVYVKTW